MGASELKRLIARAIRAAIDYTLRDRADVISRSFRMKQPLFRILALVLLASSLLAAPARALNGTWNLNPANGDWNMPNNWSSMAAPNGPADVATFGLSSFTSLFLSANTEVDSIVFSAGASAYRIAARPRFTLTLSGGGIGNMSELTQNFAAEVDGQGNFGTIKFAGSASAGTGTNYLAQGSLKRSPNFDLPGGTISFRDLSSAAHGTFTLNGGSVVRANGGLLGFYNNSTAGDAVFTAHGSGVLDALASHTEFRDSASAARAVFVNNGGTQEAYATFEDEGPVAHFSRGAEMTFRNNSTAGAASITNNGGTAALAFGSGLGFRDNSTASSATIINNGGTADLAFGGSTGFGDNSSAENAIVINNGGVTAAAHGASTLFSNSTTAGNAILIANGSVQSGEGGQIYFDLASEGGTARVQVFGNGSLDIASHDRPGVTIGSLAGTGIVYLGGNNLTVGGNGLSTTYSGLMRDGGHPGGLGSRDAGGSLTKVGTGTLTIAGSNTFTGTTTIEAGTLILDGSITSAVSVNGGILAGSGTARAVTVNSGGTLSPGNSPGILDVVGNLTLSLGSTYLVDLNGSAVGTQYDQTSVTGAIFLEDVLLSLRLGGPLLAGEQFTILSNDGTDAVTGLFGGLPEGGIFTADGQTFTISYQLGDGNDVVLTAVVPEPATWVLLSGGITLLVRRLRAQKSSCKDTLT